MFFIYGWKNELENDDWHGTLNCHNCGNDTKHMFKLEKRYPTLFFVKIPIGRTVKRHLLCTECGYHRAVKKREYNNIIMLESVPSQKVMSVKNGSAVETEQSNVPVIDRNVPVAYVKILDDNASVTKINETQSQKATVAEEEKKTPVTENILPPVKDETKPELVGKAAAKKELSTPKVGSAVIGSKILADDKTEADKNKKQRIIENKARLVVKKREEKKDIIEKTVVKTEVESHTAQVEPKFEEAKPLSEKKLMVVDGKPRICSSEDDVKKQETKLSLQKILIGILAVLVGVLIHKTVDYLRNEPSFSFGKTTTASYVNTTQTTSSTTTKPASEPYSKGYVIGNTYYNRWLNIKLELPENYKEVDEEFYRSLEEMTSDVHGMYFVSDETDSIGIGFADISSQPYITEEDFVTAAAKEAESYLSEYGNVFVGQVWDCYIAGKPFKSINVYFNDNDAVSSIYVYKLDDRMCYINVASGSAQKNVELINSIEKIYY